jgi:hypothetical protein
VATFNGIQIGGANVNPGANGIAKLGDAIASGPAQMAQAQQRGMYLGAQTAEAIAQARVRQQEFQSRDTTASTLEDDANPMSQLLDSQLGTTHASRAAYASQIRVGASLGDIAKNAAQQALLSQDPNVRAHGLAILDPQGFLAHASQEGNNATGAAFSGTEAANAQLGGNPHSVGFEGTPAQAAATQAHTAEEQASAGLKTKETEHPELFHPSMGVMPSQMNMNDPAWAAHVQAVASGAVAPTPSSGRTAGMAVAEQRDVMALNPNFKGFHYAAAAREASTVEGGQQGVTTDQSINRVGQHLGVYEQLVKDMDNGETRPGNVVSNYISKQFGGAAPTNVTLASHILGTEIIKSMANVNAGSKEERNALQEQFDTAASPEQAHGAMMTAAHLVKGQADSRALQWKNTSGNDNYYQRNLLPSTRRMLGIGDNQQVEGGAPAAAPANPAAPAAPAAGGLPGVADIDAELARRAKGR